MPEVTPLFRWDWAHLQFTRERLDRVITGEIKRLMIFMPPRHGKSELATVRLPAYWLERWPEQRVIVGAYSQTLAEKFSRKARAIARARVQLNPERQAAEDWETLKGGGLRAVGVGGGVTGQGGNLVIIDDPVKNREEAESKVYRDKVYDWYTDDLYTRLEPGAPLILIMTRWHMDDLAGRILASEMGKEFTVINLPAEAEAGDPLGRPLGAALCPDRYDITALADLRRTMGRSYTALYQQRPQPREGGMFKYSWFELVDAVPADVRRVRFWDKAATQDGGDYTAGVLMAEKNGIYYIEDVVHGQWASGERDAIIKATAEADRLKYGERTKGIDEKGEEVEVIGANPVTYGGEQEPGASGKDAAKAFIKLLSGFTVYTLPATGSKEVRADPVASQAQAGNVKVKRAGWTQSYLDEMCAFPTGSNDDMVDGTSGAFSKLNNGQTVAVPNPFYN